MSATAAGGTGVVAWSEDGKTCQNAGAVDLATATVRWTAPFTGIGNMSHQAMPAYISDPMQIAVTADLVVIAVGDDITTFHQADGTPGWTWAAPRTDTSNAYIFGIVGDKNTLLLGVSDSHLNRAYAIAVDAGTGATRWNTELTQGSGPVSSRYAYPVSASPIVFVSRHSTATTKYSDLAVFDQNGRVQATIQETGPWGILDMTSQPWGGLMGTDEWPVAISDGLLYATAARGSYGTDRQVVAFDLATGAPRWTVPTGLPSTVSSYAVFGADADGVYVGGQNLFGGGDLVIQKFSARDGKPSPAGTLASAPSRLVGLTTVAQQTPRGYLVYGVSLADQRVLLIAP
ncbi:outer membrane protein assembly factor BamB family protein [Yinghuangia aomiensis]